MLIGDFLFFGKGVGCYQMINHLIDIKVTLSLLQEMQRWYVTFVLVTEVHVSTF